MVLLLLHLLWIAKVKNWEQCLSLTPTPYLCFWEWKNNEHLLYSSSYLWEAGKKFAFHPHLFHSLLLRLKSYPPLLKIINGIRKKRLQPSIRENNNYLLMEDYDELIAMRDACLFRWSVNINHSDTIMLLKIKKYWNRRSDKLSLSSFGLLNKKDLNHTFRNCLS